MNRCSFSSYLRCFAGCFIHSRRINVLTFRATGHKQIHHLWHETLWHFHFKSTRTKQTVQLVPNSHQKGHTFCTFVEGTRAPRPPSVPRPPFFKLFRSPPATRRRWSPRWIIYTWPLSLRGSQGRRCYRRRVINLFGFSLSVVISSVWLPVDVQSASPATIMNRCEGRGCWPASRLHIAVILSLPSHSLVMTRGKFIRSELPVTSMQGLEIAVGCGHTNTAKQ